MKKLSILLFGLGVLFSCGKKEEIKPIAKPIVKPKPVYLYGFNKAKFKVINDTVKNGESFGVILDRHHVMYPTINKIATEVKDTFDVRRMRTGKPYTILASKDSTEKAQVFIYRHNKVDATVINFKDSIISAYKYKEPIKVVEREVAGLINSSLSADMDSLGLSQAFAIKMSNIYEWTLDFYRLQKGDNFKIIFDEHYINDTVKVGYGKIKAAIFNHKGKDLYAFNFTKDSILKNDDYYDEDGNMLRRAFLKSPIKFQYRISSRYNLRRRIKLYGNKIRPHKGTDFAAAYGTPIISTANGTVVESARRGGNGNYVKIKHSSTYTTQYLHMKRRGVHVGDYVKQGDVIGWVGMTGNTSGPHVCYRFWKNGKQVDPFRQDLPKGEPLDSLIKPSYLKHINPLKEQLNAIPFPLLKEHPSFNQVENLATH